MPKRIKRNDITSNDFLLISNATNPTMDFFPNGALIGFERFSPMTAMDVFALPYTNGMASTPTMLNSMTANDQQNLDLESFDDGSFMGVWESFDGADWQVMARRFDASFSAMNVEFAITSNGLGDHRRPKVTTNTNGGFTATWDQQNPDMTWSVHSRSFDNNDMPIGNEEILSSQINNFPRNPDIAGDVSIWNTNLQFPINDTLATNFGNMINDAGVNAAFDDNTNQPLTSCATRFAFGGGTDGNAGRAWTSNQIVTGARTWGSNDNGYNVGLNDITTITVYGGTTTPVSPFDGNLIGTVVTDLLDINANGADPQEMLTGFDTSTAYPFHWFTLQTQQGDAVLGEGRFLTSTNTIGSVSLDNTGAPTTSENSASEITADELSNPVIEAFPSPAQGYGLAWQTSNSILYRQLDNQGNPINPAVQVNTQPIGNFAQPAFATFPNGGAFLLWETNQNIFGNFIDGNGRLRGDDYPINQNTLGNQTDPATIRNNDNTLFASWSSMSDNSIQGRMLDTSLSVEGIDRSFDYQESEPVNLNGIAITQSPEFIDTIYTTASLSNPAAGELTADADNVGGTATSSFDPVTGTWTASGSATDLNQLFETLQFRSDSGFTNDFDITFNVDSGTTQLNSTFQFNNVASSSTLSAGAAAGIAIAALVGCLTLTGIMIGLAALYYYSRRPKFTKLADYIEEIDPDEDPKAHQQISTGEHSLQQTTEGGREIIGGKYELIRKVNRKEAKLLEEQTGIKIEFKPTETGVKVKFGKGNSGEVRLAWDGNNKRFKAYKKIVGANSVKSSKHEVETQKQLNHIQNVISLDDSVELIENNEPVLYLFMEAYYLTGSEINRKFSNFYQHSQESATKFFAYIAQKTAAGLAGMHDAGIFHFDFNPENFLANFFGDVVVSDLGCAADSIKKGQGNTKYYSPERYSYCRNETKTYDPEKSEAWAFGITLLEIFLGKYPFPKLTQLPLEERVKQINAESLAGWLKEIPELNSPNPNSVYDLINKLLTTSPAERLSIKDALKHPFLTSHQFQNNEELMEAFKTFKGHTNAPVNKEPERNHYIVDNRQECEYTTVKLLEGVGTFGKSSQTSSSSDNEDNYNNETVDYLNDPNFSK